MACCGLSRGVALVAVTRVGTAPASPSPHARVRFPALLSTARSLTMESTTRDPPLMFFLLRCHRGPEDTGTTTSFDVFMHPWTTSSSQQHLPWDAAGTYEPFRARSRHGEAAAALVSAVADAFRPLLDNLNQLRSFRTVFDIEDYHIGMPFGAVAACVGLYQVWKVAPSTCLDIALAYALYKLSVIAADLRKRGFSNDLITRIQLAIAVTMAFKDVRKDFVPLDNIRFPVFLLYIISVLWDLGGVKQYSKFALMELMPSTSPRPRKGDDAKPATHST